MATITVTVQTTSGALLSLGQHDDPIAGIAFGEEATGVTSSGMTIANAEVNREFVISGSGLAFDGEGNPTGGTITSLTVRTLDTDAPVATYDFGTGISAVDFFEAAIAFEGDDEGPADDLWAPHTFHFIGNAGADDFTGGQQSDSLVGGGGNDTLDGLPGGADTLRGGTGDDWYITDLESAPGADVILESADEGNDTVEFVTENPEPFTYTLPENLENLLLFDTFEGGEPDDVTWPFNGTGNAAPNLIMGNGGANTLLGGGGDDSLLGGAGNDSLAGQADDDLVDGGAGDDTLTAAGGSDSLAGGAGNDSILSGTADDTLFGGDGNDAMLGQSENDSLDGGNGNDTMTGAGGHDTLRGGEGDDSLLGGGGNDTADGGNGDDTLSGVTGDDTLFGGVGDDSLFGDEGNDSLMGAAGNDTVLGGNGNDTMTAAGGNDSLDGGAGNDSFLSGAGDDVLLGGDGDDVFAGQSENDSLAGGNGDDTMTGAGGDDTLAGGADADSILGGGGNDLVEGDEGNDELLGVAGNDTLDGGAGDDTLFGGDGNDAFQYTATVLGGDVAAGDADVALGIDAGDVLDITDALAGFLTVGGAFLGDGDTIGGAIDSSNNIAFDVDTNLLMIDVSGDGDFTAGEDFSIDLVGVTALTYNSANSTFSFTLDA